MSKVTEFYKYGEVRFNYNHEPIIGRPVLYVKNGTWYKFQVDDVQKLLDGTFDAISRTMVEIDGVQLITSIA